FYRPAVAGVSTPEKARKDTAAPDYARLRPITSDSGKLGTEEARILIYLLDHGQLSRKDAVALLGLGETKVKGLLSTLSDRKLVTRRGQGRGTFYVLAQKP
ncbi:MAG: ATP-dependent DNA helicase, partial [bacterium]